MLRPVHKEEIVALSEANSGPPKGRSDSKIATSALSLPTMLLAMASSDLFLFRPCLALTTGLWAK